MCESSQNINHSRSGSRRTEGLTLLLLLATVLSLYAKMWGHNEPVLDDPTQIAYVQSLNHWWECFQLDSMNWFRPFKNLVFYTTLSKTGGIQLTQISCLLLFLCNIVACHALLRKVFDKSLYRIIGTALFCLNPTMVSSVQFLSACNNQIGLLFLLLYLRFSLTFTEPKDSECSQTSRTYLIFSLSSLFLCLLSYEASVTSVGILFILLLGLRGLEGLTSPSARICLVASLLVTLSYFLIRFLAGAKNYFTSPSLPPDSSAIDLILRAPYYTWQHFTMWLWPWGQGGVLIHDNPANHFISGAISWCILLILVLSFLYGLFTRYRLAAAGALIFLGSMLPLSNYLGFANGPICNYYLLLPSLGLTLLATELLRLSCSTLNKSTRILIYLFLACYLTGYALETRMRVEFWSSDPKLRELSLKNYPNNYIHLRDEAIVLLKKDEEKKGRALIKKALQQAPWEATTASILASYYQARQRPEDALLWLEEYHSQVNKAPWKTQMRKGEILYQLQRYHEANELLPILLEAKLTNEDSCRLYFNLAVPCLIQQGQITQALHLLNSLELYSYEKNKWSKRKAYLLDICHSLQQQAPGDIAEATTNNE